ncbi:MAG: hypothetical protein ACYCY5_02420, partial [Sulfuricella sp.]
LIPATSALFSSTPMMTAVLPVVLHQAAVAVAVVVVAVAVINLREVATFSYSDEPDCNFNSCEEGFIRVVKCTVRPSGYNH